MECDVGSEVTDWGQIRTKQPLPLLWRVQYNGRDLTTLLDIGRSISMLCTSLALKATPLLCQATIKSIYHQTLQYPVIWVYLCYQQQGHCGSVANR